MRMPTQPGGLPGQESAATLSRGSEEKSMGSLSLSTHLRAAQEEVFAACSDVDRWAS